MLSRVTEQRIAVFLIVLGVVVLMSVAGGEDLAVAQGIVTTFGSIAARTLLGLVGIVSGAVLFGGGSDE